MGGMIVQEMAKKDGDKISKLVCYSTGPIGEMPGRFETVDQSRENLKKKGLEITAKNIAETWFIKGENAKYFDICIDAGKQTSMETADNSLVAINNWNGVDTLKNIKNETLILWGDQDKSYNLEQIKTLENNIENRLFNFEENIFQYINEANLAITRAGASTLSELVFLKVPFIAIPYKFATDDHQLQNALYYERAECCWILKEKEFNKDKLSTFLISIIENKVDYLNKKKNLEKFCYQNSWNKINEKVIGSLNEN